MCTKFKITFNNIFNNQSIYIRGLETFLLLFSSGACLHAFDVSSTRSNSKCWSRSLNIRRVVITYYVSRVFFSSVAVYIIIPGFEISEVNYCSMVSSDAFLNLFPPVHTCEFKCQVVVATPFPVSLFSTAPVSHTVKLRVFIEGTCANISKCVSIPHFFYISL